MVDASANREVPNREVHYGHLPAPTRSGVLTCARAAGSARLEEIRAALAGDSVVCVETEHGAVLGYALAVPCSDRDTQAPTGTLAHAASWRLHAGHLPGTSDRADELTRTCLSRAAEVMVCELIVGADHTIAPPAALSAWCSEDPNGWRIQMPAAAARARLSAPQQP